MSNKDFKHLLSIIGFEISLVPGSSEFDKMDPLTGLLGYSALWFMLQ